MLVGPNNSGKTSVMDAICLFTHYSSGNRGRIKIHDFSKARRWAFEFAEEGLNAAEDDETRIKLLRRNLPVLRLSLTFEYSDKPEDMNIVSALLMDLNPENNEVTFRIEFSLKDALGLWNAYSERRKPDETTLFDVVASDLYDYYGFTYFKVSSDGLRAQRLDDDSLISGLIRVDTISAQRHIADEEVGRATKISRLLHSHYSTYYKSEDLEGYQEIEDAIIGASTTLTAKYESAFSRLIARLSDFGYPQGTTEPEMKIKAEMSSATIYRDNTKIYYAAPKSRKDREDQPSYDLPERYNGLGYKNLIYILLEIESFRAAIEMERISQPGVHLICIEEPEVHLHPQMQTAFIREISRILADDEESTAQVILSTHSPHMVADSGFSPIRYFKRKYAQVIVRDLSELPFGNGAEEDGKTPILEFLRRYIKLTHCDLLFADKAILVEGQVERLLLPFMIEKVEEEEGFESISGQYITVLEIGGAYAHKIEPFLRFIDIPTLVIADIDSARSDRKKCPVAEGEITTNAVINYWLPEKPNLVDLLEAPDEDRTRGIFHIAYQNYENGHCGRSFEEAFVYANLDWIPENVEEFIGTESKVKWAVENGLEESAYEFGAKISKVDFALDLMNASGWHTPAYIEDGLKWLSAQESAT
jgi:hypothetical protein